MTEETKVSCGLCSHNQYIVGFATTYTCDGCKQRWLVGRRKGGTGLTLYQDTPENRALYFKRFKTKP